MTIKTRTAIWIVGIVSVLVLVLCGFVYLEFQSSEKKLFQQRLREKALNTVKLLEEVKEVDSTLLRLIDKNTLDQIRDEKVWVLDAQNKVIYSSIDDLQWQPNNGLLDSIRKSTYLTFKIGNHEAIGLMYPFQGKERLVIAAGKDQEGIGALNSLLQILVFGFFTILVLVAFTAYLVAKQVLKPLVVLHNEVESISDERMSRRIPIPKDATKDEIVALAGSFNLMLERLQDAFIQQKQFIQHASHELRTPLAALTNQIDLALQQDRSPAYYKALLLSLQEDHDRLSTLIHQLLVLFRSGQAIQQDNLVSFYFNEMMEACIGQVELLYPYAKIYLNYLSLPEQESDLMIKGNDSLLSTALLNLLENACKYGSGHPIKIEIGFDPHQLQVAIHNQGPIIPEQDRDKLFVAFFRSSNTSGKKGFGLGLMLTHKIALLHQGKLSYQVVDGNNCFVWILPKQVNA